MTAMRFRYFSGLMVAAALVAGGCGPKVDAPTTRRGQSPETPPEREPSAQQARSKPGPSRTTQPPDSQLAEPEPQPARSATDSSAPAESNPENSAAPDDVMGQIDPAELVLPKVLLSNGQAATCLVKVGDPMPPITLPDLAGKQQSLAQLLGENLTVVVFWRGDNPYSVAELADLESDVVKRFGSRGVRVVAINEHDEPDQVREAAHKLGLKFPVLLDTDGHALAEVATRKLPRTYLLDASGKIVWFDMDYSRSTWRELRQAIQFLLSQG